MGQCANGNALSVKYCRQTQRTAAHIAALESWSCFFQDSLWRECGRKCTDHAWVAFDRQMEAPGGKNAFASLCGKSFFPGGLSFGKWRL